MTIWEARGNAYCCFAMKMANGEIYMVSFDDLCFLELYGQWPITEKEFPSYQTLDQWIVYMEHWRSNKRGKLKDGDGK